MAERGTPIELRPEEWPCDTCRGAIVALTERLAAAREAGALAERAAVTAWLNKVRPHIVAPEVLRQIVAGIELGEHIEVRRG